MLHSRYEERTCDSKVSLFFGPFPKWSKVQSSLARQNQTDLECALTPVNSASHSKFEKATKLSDLDWETHLAKLLESSLSERAEEPAKLPRHSHCTLAPARAGQHQHLARSDPAQSPPPIARLESTPLLWHRHKANPFKSSMKTLDQSPPTSNLQKSTETR